MTYISYFPAGVNLLLCVTIMGICLCRLDKIDKSVLLRIGMRYVLLLSAAAASGVSPLIYEFPGWSAVFFAAAVLFMLLSDGYEWRAGPPESATVPGALSEH